MAYDSSQPDGTNANMGTAYTNVQNNFAAIARLELPKTDIGTNTSITIPTSAVLVRLTGAYDISTVTITPISTLPDIVVVWAYADTGFTFRSGGNIYANQTPFPIRPYVLFRLVYIKALAKVAILYPQEGHQTYMNQWSRRGIIERQSSGTGMLVSGFNGITPINNYAVTQYDGYENVQFYNAVAAATSGILPNYYTEVALGFPFRVGFLFRMNTVADCRYWFGLASENPDAVDAPAGVAAYCAIRWSSVAGDVNFKLVTRVSGGANVITDLGVAPGLMSWWNFEIFSEGPGHDLRVYLWGRQVASVTAPAWPVNITDTCGPVARCKAISPGVPNWYFVNLWAERP